MIGRTHGHYQIIEKQDRRGEVRRVQKSHISHHKAFNILFHEFARGSERLDRCDRGARNLLHRGLNRG